MFRVPHNVRGCTVTAAAVLLASFAGAQPVPSPGDLLVCGAVPGWSGVAHVDLTNNVLHPYPALPPIHSVAMAPDNRAFVGIARTAAGQVFIVHDPTVRRTTTLLTSPLPGAVGGFVNGQDSAYYLTDRQRLLRFESGRLTTLTSLAFTGSLADLARDPETGELVAAESIRFLNLPTIYRYDPVAGQVTTVAVPTMLIGALAVSQPDGDLWVYDTVGQRIRRLDRQGNEISSFAHTRPSGSVPSLTVHHPTGNLYVTAGDRIELFSPSGQRLGSWQPMIGVNLTQVRIYGRESLACLGDGRRGAWVPMALRFTGSGGWSYCLALSLSGLRPGFRVQGQTIYINPDPLFAATACGGFPAITRGFVGVLDATGAALPSFFIGSAIPRGTRFTVAAVAIDPARPGRLVVAPSVTVLAR